MEYLSFCNDNLIPKAMNIKNIDIYNVRCLSQKFEFSPGFNVVTGRTGSGKTTLLKCLALSTMEKGFPVMFGKKEMRNEHWRGNRGDNWGFTMESDMGSMEVRHYGNLNQTEEHWRMKVITCVAYGSNRIIYTKGDNTNQQANRVITLFDDHVGIALDIDNWLKGLKIEGQYEFLQWVADVLNLSRMFRGIRFTTNIDSSGMKVTRDKNLDCYFSGLSKGTRSLLTLILDIIMNNTSYQYGEFFTPGVVLVDDIETHIHPVEQKMLVSGLKKLFPNVQFIATTNSRVIASCADKVISLD